ncbi:uncharacterized protein LOC128989059 isoform X2 [Macrosteles quadrilineatus]|uniref:uncharacterized protein LOC128989059 isoform X2 n=1 Tax=Macrosteles quadrilineatus TaxID=74068 RepID=UPI0023E11724|nr:uncharacterized protein LOC128989059 isoform X2 [Macrosteles quadrilineatus]
MDLRIVWLCLLILFVDKSRTQPAPVNNTTTGKECLTNDECISGKICRAKKCTDPCDTVCGLNTICVVHEGAPMCSCKTGYKGDPFTECKPLNAECTDDSICTTDKACIGHKCVDPCLDYCGLNTVCRVVNHQPVCACLNGFFYKLDKGCLPERIPECQTNSHCPEDRSCRLQKCVDPCEDGVCGNNTECHVKNHYPVCSCKGSVENEENIQKPIEKKKTFLLVEEQKTWWDALIDCIDRGMNLASIENDKEWNTFLETVRYIWNEDIWIGGHDLDNYPNFIWISTGQRLSHTHWKAGEPSSSDCHCLFTFKRVFINGDCAKIRKYVCEQRKNYS